MTTEQEQQAQRRNDTPGGNGWRQRRFLPYLLLLLVGGLLLLPNRAAPGPVPGDAVTYSKAVELIKAEKVEKAWVQEGPGRIVLDLENAEENVNARFPAGESQKVLDLLIEAGVESELKPAAAPSLLPSLLFTLLPVVLIIGFFVVMARKGGLGGGLGALSLGKSQAAPVDVPKTKFADVAGIDDALVDLQEVVDFLHNPERYTRTGAKRPRGFLLVGPPGTGKTLLARAVAGEAGVPFYAITGADFVELFAGLGASRVRDLFSKARQQEKAIIFIDEIDAVGKIRGRGIQTGANDERENTLNALLVELDGFTARDGIIILGATNRADVLDPALLRPGRFDRTIMVPAPDRSGRRKILELYAKDRPFAADIDWDALARRTPGMTGAQIEQLMNEAALEAARKAAETITAGHVETALQTTMLGRERRGSVISERDRSIVAWHEAGHALCAMTLKHAEKPAQVSIIPRGGTGGATWMQGGEHDLTTRSQALAQLVVAMGGRAAEEVLLEGDYTQGAHGDLAASTQLATQMVSAFGMGKDLIARSGEKLMFDGPVSLEVDREVAAMIEEALEKARGIMRERAGLLRRIAEELLEQENLSAEDLLALEQLERGRS